jgi:hypothetical protein
MDLERAIKPALAGADWRLGLDQDKRQAVDQQHKVWAFLSLAGAEGELLGDDKAVLLDVAEVDQADGRGRCRGRAERSG